MQKTLNTNPLFIETDSGEVFINSLLASLYLISDVSYPRAGKLCRGEALHSRNYFEGISFIGAISENAAYGYERGMTAQDANYLVNHHFGVAGPGISGGVGYIFPARLW